jgi:L-threonylcarbamoyladenylate synthase|tara:strand:- start:6163 stop:6786 length:624 start_codon:yes stop_codon:yes gene_type:complete
LLQLNYNKNDLSEAVNIIKNGGIIIYPTDTLYGIGCNPFDATAIRKLNKLKKRSSKPLPVLCSDLNHAENLVYLGELGKKLASRFWPGGLTIIAKNMMDNLPMELIGNSGGVGVRIPNHEGALKIISCCGGKLVATSANISGRETAQTPEEIRCIFEDKFDVLIYGDYKPSGVQSTVVDVVNGTARIIREGIVSTKELKRTLNSEKQ